MKEYRPIRGRDLDGAHLTELDARQHAADVRRTNAIAQLCINGASHGKATHGSRCHRCAAVHRYGVAEVDRRGLGALDMSDRRFNTQRFSTHCISHLGAA